LNCLHSIPCHLRPVYRVRSIIDCRTAILHHIRSRICYLSPLTDRQFFQIFFSVVPFYTDRLSTRTMLMDIIFLLPSMELLLSQLFKHCSLRSPTRISVRGAKNKILILILDKIQENYRCHSVWVPPISKK
jgi:hypothetical protein